MKKPLVELINVGFSYNGISVLKDINFTVFEGEFIGVVGPNAGGKSTLLKIILGLLKPITGKVQIAGKQPEKMKGIMGYVPQYPTFPRDFPMTVEQLVLMGRLGKTRFWGGYTQADKKIARQAMQVAEIQHLSKRSIHALSGGQLQRALVSRALATEPDVLILDEPTANIDMRVETDIFDLLKILNKKMSIIVVSHDIAFISGYVERVACLNQTLLCHDTREIDGQLIDSLYGSHVHQIEHVHE